MFTPIAFLKRLSPALARVSFAERLRSSLGALVGILLTGLVSRHAIGQDVNLPLLIAPMGASAVLLFAAPTSPLAQPWSILGGNIVSALIGVTCGIALKDPLLASAAAIACSIGAMLVLNCLHPPSGAVALTAVLGGASIHEAGYWFVLSPVGLNTLILLATALAFNNVTGRQYPHLTPPAGRSAHRTADDVPSHRIGTLPDDLTAVLEQYDEIVNVSPDELDALLHQAQIRAYSRRTGEITCGEIMSRDLVTVSPTTSLRTAWRLLLKHSIKALPVVSPVGELVGIVTQTDFMKHSVLSQDGRLRLGLNHRLIARLRKRPPLDTVADIMTRRVQSALPETRIARLVPPMADTGLHHMPIVDAENRVVGIVTQSDLIAALFQRSIETLDTDPEATESAAL